MQRIANLAMVGCPYIKLRLAQRHNVVHRHIWSGLCWTTTGHHLNQPATPEWWLHMRLQGCDTRGFMPLKYVVSTRANRCSNQELHHARRDSAGLCKVPQKLAGQALLINAIRSHTGFAFARGGTCASWLCRSRG